MLGGSHDIVALLVRHSLRAKRQQASLGPPSPPAHVVPTLVTGDPHALVMLVRAGQLPYT